MTAYTTYGREVDATDRTAMAKVESTEKGHKTYFIKRVHTGHNFGWLVNFETIKTIPIKNMKYDKVSEEAFNHYLQYLQTGNEIWLRHAQRQVNV